MLRVGRISWSLFCSFCKTFLNSLSTSFWRRSERLVRSVSTKVSLYEQRGKIMQIARFCTSSSSLERYTGRPSWKTGQAYSVIGRIQVQKNWTNSRVPRSERLSWDKLYKRFLAFPTMKLMWQFHVKSLEMLGPSILALVVRSMGLPLTTTGSKELGLLVLKFIRSYCISFRLVETYPRSHGFLGCQQQLKCDCLGSCLSSPK